MSEFWNQVGFAVAANPVTTLLAFLGTVGVVCWTIGSVTHKFFDHLTERHRFRAIHAQAQAQRAHPQPRAPADEEEDEDPPPAAVRARAAPPPPPPPPPTVYDRLRANAQAGQEPQDEK